MSLFDWSDDQQFGAVFGVDTGSVLVQVENLEELRRLQVNHLVCLRSSKAGQHLIGVIEKIMRKAVEHTAESDEESEMTLSISNFVRIILVGTLIDRVGTRTNIFKRTLESVPEIDAPCFVLSGKVLTDFMRAISQSGLTETNNPLSIGRYTLDENAVAWLDGNRFFQRHAVIVGSTGSGKSWTVARILEQTASLTNANAILFDIHGEYSTLTQDGVHHLRIAGSGDQDGSHDLDDGVLHLPYWLLTYDELIALLLDRSDNNAPNQAMVLARSITNRKRAFIEHIDNKDVLANFTIDSPIPFKIEDVLNDINVLNTERVEGARGDKAGPYFDKLTRFSQRLEAKMNDRRLTFLFPQAEATLDYEWLPRLAELLLRGNSKSFGGGVKIIDFSEVPSDILPLMTGLVGRLVFSLQQWTSPTKRHPIALFCDEAHLYLPERLASMPVAEAGFQSFERIAKEGRKYGVGLVVISQRPAEVNRTILSQCNNFLAMRLTNADDQAVVRRLLPDSLGGVSSLLPILDIGEALAVGDATCLPTRIRIDQPKKTPNSATIPFWDSWCKPEIALGTKSAVNALRRQSKS